jgi:hypothetical protein
MPQVSTLSSRNAPTVRRKHSDGILRSRAARKALAGIEEPLTEYLNLRRKHFHQLIQPPEFRHNSPFTRMASS